MNNDIPTMTPVHQPRWMLMLLILGYDVDDNALAEVYQSSLVSRCEHGHPQDVLNVAADIVDGLVEAPTVFTLTTYN